MKKQGTMLSLGIFDKCLKKKITLQKVFSEMNEKGIISIIFIQHYSDIKIKNYYDTKPEPSKEKSNILAFYIKQIK